MSKTMTPTKTKTKTMWNNCEAMPYRASTHGGELSRTAGTFYGLGLSGPHMKLS